MRCALVMASIIATLGACGASDVDAPYSAPPPDCPEVDDFLQPLFALQDQGKLTHLAAALSSEVPEQDRRDLVDALLRLLTAFERGRFAALDALPVSDGGPGLQVTLGKVVRWLAETGPHAPNLPLVGVLRRALATCEGQPVFELLAEAITEPTLIQSVVDLLAGADLGAALEDLDFEGESGRTATQYLVRNLLVSASSPDFDVERILQLIGLLVDLDAPPYDTLADGLRSLLDADGLPRLQGLLVCLGEVDPHLELGGFVFDLITSDLLRDLLGLVPTESDRELLPAPLRAILADALGFLASDAEARRALVPTLEVLLRDDLVAPVLGDVANLLDAEALGGVVDLLAELASGACRR